MTTQTLERSSDVVPADDVRERLGALDVQEFLDHIDPREVLDRIDVPRLVARLDPRDLLDRIDAEGLLGRLGLRRSRPNPGPWLLTGALVGGIVSGLALYFVDPVAGRGRRARATDRLAAGLRRVRGGGQRMGETMTERLDDPGDQANAHTPGIPFEDLQPAEFPR